VQESSFLGKEACDEGWPEPQPCPHSHRGPESPSLLGFHGAIHSLTKLMNAYSAQAFGVWAGGSAQGLRQGCLATRLQRVVWQASSPGGDTHSGLKACRKRALAQTDGGPFRRAEWRECSQRDIL
jgi:hypothetical protein